MKSMLLLLFCILPLFSFAQEEEEEEKSDEPKVKDFTYANDRRFLSIMNIYGYTFVPAKGKISNAHFEEPIKMGALKILITPEGAVVTERVNFTTAGIGGENDSKPRVMSQRTEKTKFGYEVTLMDIHNPNLQGYVQFYIDKGYIYEIRLKKEQAENERVLYLTLPSRSVDARDAKYYTHEQELSSKELSDLFKKDIFPFGELKNVGNYQEYNKIYPSDSVFFRIQDSTVTKGKKSKTTIYFDYFDKRIKEMPVRSFIVKKINNEAKYQDIINEKERDAIELVIQEKKKNNKFTCYILRNNVTKKIDGILIGDTEYVMRTGKPAKG
jgi:hypothetical protein